jgi:hypothetical protein
MQSGGREGGEDVQGHHNRAQVPEVLCSEPTVGSEGAQGPEGLDPAPLQGGGDPRWFPGDGPAAVGLLIPGQAVEVAVNGGVAEQAPPWAVG